MQRFYGLDLGEAIWGTCALSGRRLGALVTGLPHDGALGVALGAYTPGWGTLEDLMALVAEIGHEGNRILMAAHSEKGATIPESLHIPRPHDPPPPERRMASTVELEAFLGRTTGTAESNE